MMLPGCAPALDANQAAAPMQAHNRSGPNCGVRGDYRMAHATLTVIRDEHAALAAMLRSVLLLLALYRRRAETPDFGLLRAMLFYIDEFPQRLHHPKESTLLFPKLRLRSDAVGAVLDRLDREHDQGESMIRNVERALLGFEIVGESRRAAFEQTLQSYVDFYLAHMRTEELEVLPLAQQVLTESDWAELDAEFSLNRDPLTGHEPHAQYRALFSRIVCLTPAPIGLGPAGS
jgi:hemerythrin-like domain-containing protein